MAKHNFEYRVSVVIPVYNAEEFLPDCLNSLTEQTIDASELEVLLIVDGSQDGSLEICKRHAEKYGVFKVIEQENMGVSATRNHGIHIAKGKYIMFLDSDDTLTPETVANVVDFFDAHYDETDVVTYPIQYVTGKGTSTHWRYNILTHTDVYDLEQNPYICQTTMNICVKNMGDKQIYFNDKLKMAEDQLFVTENLLEKGKIGFVKNACYKYLKHGDNQSNRGNHPFYALEQMFLLYDALLGYKKDYPKMSAYLESMVIYNIEWRLRQNMFYTHHFEGKQQEEIRQKYTNVFNGLSNKVLLNFPILHTTHKNYIIMQKTENKPTAQLKDGKLTLVDCDGEVLSETNTIDVGITRCQFEKNSDVFYLQGYIENYAIDISGEMPELYVERDGETNKPELYPSGRRYFKSDIPINNFWAFHYKTDLSENMKSIRIYVVFQGHKYPVKFNFQDTQPMQPDVKRSTVKGEKTAVCCAGDTFEVCTKNSFKVKKIMLRHLMYLLFNNPPAFLKRIYCLMNKLFNYNRIWLYNDSYSTASDNGCIQFMHDFEKDDKIKRYYIYEDEKLIEGKFNKKQRKYLVKFRSGKHKRLYIRAEKVLTSFLNFNSFIPFTSRKSAINFLDLTMPEIIYLQHGVLHAKIPNMYHKENSYMGDKIVVSTPFEHENFVSQLGYRDEDIINSGMPRLDLLKNSPEKLKNKILFAPSWRAYLIGPLIDSSRTPYPEFDTSEYFVKFYEFLSSKRLASLLEEYDLTVDVKVHPIFSCYKEKFVFNNKRINIVNEVDLAEYKLCVTDFSSYLFDLLYLCKPVIMFMPDKEKFCAGLHTYREFYLPLNDGFGDYVESAEECIDAIYKLAKRNFAVDERYAEKVERFFYSHDSGHREALYKSLI